MINNLIWEALGRIKIYKNSELIVFNELEKHIFNYISFNEKGNYIYVMPKDNDYFLMVAIIYSVLKMSYYNVFQGGVDILEVINNGEIVKYNNTLCIYEGMERGVLLLRFRDGRIHLPKSLRYKLSKYNGDAKVLNKMPTKSLSAAKRTKNLLAQIMDINIDEICKVSKKSILLIGNKQRINEFVKSIEIKVGENEKVALTEVFPMAYYSSIDNIYNYKGNSKKEEPLVKFTSKVYIANEMCKKYKNISSVLFLPKKLVIDDLIELKEIERKKNISNVSSIVWPIDIERQIGNEYLHEDFNVKSIDINLPQMMDVKKFNERQYEYCKNYIRNNIEIKMVNETEINIFRKKINSECSKLIKLFNDDSEIIRLVISARKITKRIVSIPIPLKHFDEIISVKYPAETVKNLWNNFRNIWDETMMRNLSSDVKNNITKIYDLIESLYSIVDKENNKWNELRRIITLSNSKNILVINDNKIILYGVKGYLRKIYPLKYNITFEHLASNNKKGKLFDIAIYTGMLEDNMYNNYRKYNSKQVICLFYKFETSYFEYLRRRYDSFIKNIDANESVVKDSEIYIQDKANYTDDDIARELELEVRLEELLITSYISSATNSNANSQTMNLCSRVLKFTDGKRAFISKQYSAYELDEEREEILLRKPNELAVGQVLLFVDDIEKDIVDSTIKDLMSVERINEIYEKAYYQSKEWKNILKIYMDINEYNYNDIERKLRKYGVSRTGPTIRSWIVDSIVGPQEKEIFKAIAQMTGDKNFIDNYNEIYESCNTIRSFQIRVRKAIAKHLLQIKSTEENDEIDNIIIDNCSGKFNYVIKVEVAKVLEIDKEIPCYLANKVLEE